VRVRCAKGSTRLWEGDGNVGACSKLPDELNGASLNFDMNRVRKILTNSPSVAWIIAAFLKPPVLIGVKPAPLLDSKDIKAVNY